MHLRAMAYVAPVVLLLCASVAPAQERKSGLDKLGSVNFPVSCAPAAQQEFDRGVALLHSFFYSAAVKTFTAVAEKDAGCAMAHWGVAMSLWYPLWFPPGEAAFKRGREAVERAKTIGAKTARERDYIGAIEMFYRDADKLAYAARALAYATTMEQLAARYPEDREAAIFYALSLQATAKSTDKTYANQLKSAAILEKIFAEQPDHPGVAHYIIHAYDVPALASRALVAARRYGQIAPAVPHALHMPSHIYTQLGMWPDSIQSNRASENAARDLGDVQPQFHAIDYQVYAHLQMAQDAEAKRALERMGRLKTSGVPANLAYAANATPARYAVERRQWAEAAALEPAASQIPHAEAVTHFARALGAARAGNPGAARQDVEKLAALRDALVQAKQGYWANRVEVERRTAAAWLARAEGKNEEALGLMRAAADLEATTDKNPVTPAWLAPARELLGEMLLELGRPAQALQEFEASLRNEPNRFWSFYGAGRAAERLGDRENARTYYAKLVALSEKADTERPELRQAKAFLANR